MTICMIGITTRQNARNTLILQVMHFCFYLQRFYKHQNAFFYLESVQLSNLLLSSSLIFPTNIFLNSPIFCIFPMRCRLWAKSPSQVYLCCCFTCDLSHSLHNISSIALHFGQSVQAAKDPLYCVWMLCFLAATSSFCLVFFSSTTQRSATAPRLDIFFSLQLSDEIRT